MSLTFSLLSCLLSAFPVCLSFTSDLYLWELPYTVCVVSSVCPYHCSPPGQDFCFSTTGATYSHTMAHILDNKLLHNQRLCRVWTLGRCRKSCKNVCFQWVCMFTICGWSVQACKQNVCLSVYLCAFTYLIAWGLSWGWVSITESSKYSLTNPLMNWRSWKKKKTGYMRLFDGRDSKSPRPPVIILCFSFNATNSSSFAGINYCCFVRTT